jgi:hypothetical protein
MIRKLVWSEFIRNGPFLNTSARGCLMLLVIFSTALVGQNADGVRTSAADLPIHVTHTLGLEGIPKNATGNLSIQEGALQFQRDAGRAVQISIGSIQDVSHGEQDKQVGGVPMALGQAATPFGGGRVIGLFSHKKYDFLTVEYLDPNGGLHGAIFQLNKGQGQVFRDKLHAEGAHVALPEDQATKESTSENKK